jgi:uncharacterized protein YecT (DUF1311 family)
VMRESPRFGLRVASPKRPVAISAAVLIVLGLIVGAPTAAGALTQRPNGSSSALKPPVITEDFKPVIACDPTTTAGQEGCGEHKVLAADAQLDADLKVIFDLLTGDAARRDFVTAQTAWLTFRNADCKSQSDAYQGGTEQPVAYIYCLAADDSTRRQELKGFYNVLTQGLDHAPKFP